jgi:ATP-dependent RNA helicase MSS116, mitochondrial
MQIEFMTNVQEKSFPIVLSGVDIFVKAKTGTGKTLAFLVPSLENMIRARGASASSNAVILIISPTRELALQIAAEAESLCRFIPPLQIVTLVGGTNVAYDVKVSILIHSYN